MDRIDDMQAFVAVVQEGSFTRAADRLDTSPQMISKQVSRLEERLGVRLLNRTTRKVHLTEAGERFASRAATLLEDFTDLENLLGDYQADIQGQLRITAPASFATLHLPRLLCDFQQAFPKIRIDLQLNDRKVDIIDEGFDVALRIGQLDDSSLIARYLAPIRLVRCASPAYLDQYGRPRNEADLKSHQFLGYSYTRQVAYPGKVALESNNGEILMKCAIEGAGIAQQPTFICGRAIQEGKLEVLLPESEPEPMGLYAVFAHRKLLAPKVRCFIDFIDGYFGEVPSWDRPGQT